jgi:hypothetical protein
MSDFERKITHLVTVTLKNDADIYSGWATYAEKVIRNPGHLSHSRREMYEDGTITLREAVRAQLAAELRTAFDQCTHSSISDGTAVGGMMQNLLDESLARVDWSTVARTFMPPEDEPVTA